MLKKLYKKIVENREREKKIAERKQFIVECPDCGELVDYWIQSGICPHKPINHTGNENNE